MINNLISGIANKLFELFNFTVYADEIKQGMKTPCFLITPVQISKKEYLNERHNRICSFDLLYFPKQKKLVEMLKTADKMLSDFIYITLPDGSLIRGTGQRYEIVDGVLHFFINFNFIVKNIPEEIEKMDNLQYIGGLKNGNS